LKNQQLDDADFESLLQGIRPRLVGYLLSLTSSLAAAEDLAQETAVILWRKRAEFDPSGSFPAWAFRIAFLQVMNFRRKEGRRLSHELPGEETFRRLEAPDPGFVDIFSSASRDALLYCLGKMREAQRELLLRRYSDGTSLEELSLEEGTNPNALAQKIFRLKKGLFACLRKQGVVIKQL